MFNSLWFFQFSHRVEKVLSEVSYKMSASTLQMEAEISSENIKTSSSNVLYAFKMSSFEVHACENLKTQMFIARKS